MSTTTEPSGGSTEDDDLAVGGVAVQPIAARMADTGGRAALDEGAGVTPGVDVGRAQVSGRWIALNVLAYLGGNVALIAPLGLSLSLRIQELVPQNVEVLGYVVGAGAAAAGLSQPLIGMLSDRSRTRLGRRRPFSLGGSVLGIIGLATMAAAPSVWLLTLGWLLTQLGWGSANASLLHAQADRLPEAQHGKVAGLTGFMQMIGSVVGVGMASLFIGSNFLIFLVPGFFGLILVLLWVWRVAEPDSRSMTVVDRLTPRRVFAGMFFNPAAHPSFAWNWLGRLLFYVGVSFATTYTTLFFASRMSDGGRVADIGGLVAALSLVGVVATAGGALCGGLLSDRFQKRRVFVLLSGIVFTAGAVTMALGGSNLAVLVAGSVLTSLGLGVFAAVDGAIVLDILPDRETDAGRFTGINGYSTSLAQTLAPVLAAPLLLVGVTGAERNYGLLFIVAAFCTLVGGGIVLWKVRGSN